VDCSLEDDHDRPALTVEETEGELGVYDITGQIRVRNPFGVRSVMGRQPEKVPLSLTPAGWHQ
jgi:hypothetical protein